MDKQNRNKRIDTENKLMVAIWGGLEEGCQLQKQLWGVQYTTGNIVNDIVTNMYGVRCV